MVGAGASVEESLQSGMDREHPPPIIGNFANNLFNESAALQTVVAGYLIAHGIAYDDAVIRAYEAEGQATITSEQMNNSPRCVFQRLEAADSSTHNVERLFEYVWQKHGDDGELWEALAWGRT